MTETSDAELLTAWVTQRREPAFHALVVRYAGLVHMASKRACGDDSLAADASQLVFIQLAQKAKSLLGHPSLAGWLHVTAVMKTRELLGKNQRESRKLNRFHSAMEPESSTPLDGVWQEIQPHLNDALETLSKNDREAILLRFYRSLSVKEIAATLGIATDAAQKRLDRATERLREKLTRRGVTTAGSLSAVMLAGYASEAKAAPFSASLLSSKAIAASAASTTGITSIVLLIMTKKTTIAAVALLLLAGGAAVAIKYPALFSKPASATREKRLAEFEKMSASAEDPTRSSGAKRPGPASAADAALIVKYGESRVKLARYTLATLLEINETGMSLLKDSSALMPPGEMELKMQTREFEPVIENLKLNPEQCARLGQLYKESFARKVSELPVKIQFVRDNATAAKELLLVADAAGKGKAPMEEFQRLQEASATLDDTLNYLIRDNSGDDSPGMALKDPTFVAEFTKVLDSSQAGTFKQFVESETAKRQADSPDLIRLGLEGLDESNQSVKSILEPTRQALDAIKKIQDMSGTGKK
jgi:RNA polymerase sigma factor (sigma-70 family)